MSSAAGHWRAIVATVLALLGGSAGAAATPAPPAAQPSDWARQIAPQLKSLAGKSPLLEWQARDDGLPSLRLDDGAFDGDSGELQATLLAPLGRLAAVAQQDGPCVVHVIGELIGDAVSPEQDLGERRAAAVAALLTDLGLPPGRVRYESRLVVGRAAGVDIVLRPLVAGREARAWMPPPDTGGS